MSRRRFLKNITGMLVATAIPKPLLNIEEIVKDDKSYYQIALEKRKKRMSEQLEKAMWAGNSERMRIRSNGTFYVNYDKL